ncbi:TPA: hypothetical protein N3J09_000867 [Salmonella enterica subsp. enterica serovar Panama]|nr:hypothetical protein [Salmonella enterica]HCM4642377.1 hypothetical protein [Salmonella enterica subsp. enterica serovar Panama]
MKINISEATCLERIKALNADNQRIVRVNLGILKAARSEILAHVAINGKGVMTNMVLNALNSAINDAQVNYAAE